jgi:chromosomal replication initiation ATPase DnaA
VVLIDRIDDILCSSEAQEKMIALFDNLLKKKKQMVFTIETPLDKVRIFCERLYCRLSSGVIAEIESNV